MTSAFKHPNDSPGFVLWKLTTNWQRQIRQALTATGITHVQFVCLACLWWLSTQQQETVTQQLLADTANLDKMVVSETINKLAKQGLVGKQSHTADSRCKTLTLTPAGLKIVTQAVPLVEAADRVFF